MPSAHRGRSVCVHAVQSCAVESVRGQRLVGEQAERRRARDGPDAADSVLEWATRRFRVQEKARRLRSDGAPSSGKRRRRRPITTLLLRSNALVLMQPNMQQTINVTFRAVHRSSSGREDPDQTGRVGLAALAVAVAAEPSGTLEPAHKRPRAAPSAPGLNQTLVVSRIPAGSAQENRERRL